MKRNGGPAFPREDYQANGGNGTADLGQEGMSLRDYFAAQALPECLRVAADQTTANEPLLSALFDKAAAYAYYAADAMITERDKK